MPTGDAELDARNRKRHDLSPPLPSICEIADGCFYSLEDELARLEKNKDRRLAREKAKGLTAPSPADAAISPDDAAAGKPQPQGTQRKCANCGQVGHIKTNKKYSRTCPSCKFPYDSKPSTLAQTMSFPNSW
jgi:transcription initiation factor TFIID subunit 1